MQVLRKTLGVKGAAEVIKTHRDVHITKRDFERIRDSGLNSVRLPFGYWVVTGPTRKDPYVGPGLEYIDLAVNWAEECGLQIVLDLHGCPGGESGEAPCGFRQREGHQWNWRKFRMKESLEVVKVLAQRYRGRQCVTGIGVCNEPSNEIPESRLLAYYEKAVDVVRSAGMPASRVSVVLPCFQRPEEQFITNWKKLSGRNKRNICFDIHCYHCFENEFNGKTFAQQLRHVQQNQVWLPKYPVVVGEWSLALGCATWATCGNMSDEEVQRLFGTLQKKAFASASHGSFFWNWTEHSENLPWNFQLCHQQGLLSGPPPQLPVWSGVGEDPLEEVVHPSPLKSHILSGEAVYFRVFHGRYIDVEGCHPRARWSDKGAWQELSFWPIEGETGREVRDGQVVRLRTSGGRFLSTAARGESVTAAVPKRAVGPRAEWIVCLQDSEVLRHRGLLCLQNRATMCMLDADEEEESIQARWEDTGAWQTFAVEKDPALQQVVKRRRLSES